jgi:hypothetical protein
LQISPIDGATYTFDWAEAGLALELNGQAITRGQTIPASQLFAGGLVLTATADLSALQESDLEITVTGRDVENNPTGTDTIKTRLPALELLVDANRDGKMSFTDDAAREADKTTSQKPYVFWVNNDHDEGRTVDKSDWEEDDYPGTSDCLYNEMRWKRDLEDFARLWVGFEGMTALVKSEGLQIPAGMEVGRDG